MHPVTADEIRGAYAEARGLQEARRYGEALPLYLKIARARPQLPEPHFQIGRILTETHRADQALKHFEAAAATRPGELDIWLGWAEALALGGDRRDEKIFLDALRFASVAIERKVELQDRFGSLRSKTRPAMGGLTTNEASALVRMIETRQFESAYSRAEILVRKHDRSAFTHNMAGIAASALGRYADAEKHFTRAINIDPRFAEAHDNYARLLIDLKRNDEAMTHLRRAVTIAPGLVSALLNYGLGLNRIGQPAAAVVLLKRAVLQGGNLANSYSGLGNAYTRMRDYESAEAAFEAALENSESAAAETIALLGQTHARLGKDGLAMENFERALNVDSACAIAVNGKAALLQNLGDFAQADALFERGFTLDPDNGENYRLYVAARKISSEDKIVHRMIDKFTTASIEINSRANFGFALAKAYDDLRDYHTAFEYLSRANELIKEAFPYDISSRLSEVAGVTAAYREYDWDSSALKGTSEFAPIFVTGLPRSGTTLVEQIISSHSAVAGAGEVGHGAQSANALIFNNGRYRSLRSVPDKEVAAFGDEYRRKLQDKHSGFKFITDKSIQTYMHLGLVKLALPSARFIVVRRDPRDNLLSIYRNKFPEGTHLYAYDQRDLAIYYDTFVKMIEFWRERVPEWFYEVDYDKLVSDPEPEARKLISACGLDWEDACLRPEENDRKVETLSVYQARQPISKGSVSGWRRYEENLKPMLDELKARGLVSD